MDRVQPPHWTCMLRLHTRRRRTPLQLARRGAAITALTVLYKMGVVMHARVCAACVRPERARNDCRQPAPGRWHAATAPLQPAPAFCYLGAQISLKTSVSRGPSAKNGLFSYLIIMYQIM